MGADDDQAEYESNGNSSLKAGIQPATAAFAALEKRKERRTDVVPCVVSGPNSTDRHGVTLGVVGGFRARGTRTFVRMPKML